MLTGLGSKYTVLKEFQQTALRKELCIVINGFNPTFSLSELLNLIANRFLSLHNDSLRQDQLVNLGIVMWCTDEERIGGLCECNKSFVYRDSFDRRRRSPQLPEYRLFGRVIRASMRSFDLFDGPYSRKSPLLVICSLSLSICLSWRHDVRSLLLRNHVHVARFTGGKSPIFFGSWLCVVVAHEQPFEDSNAFVERNERIEGRTYIHRIVRALLVGNVGEQREVVAVNFEGDGGSSVGEAVECGKQYTGELCVFSLPSWVIEVLWYLVCLLDWKMGWRGE